MLRPSSLLVVVAVLAAGAAGMPAHAASGISKVTGSIDVAAGEQAGDVATVNGSIHLAAGAGVDHAHTVNGSITLMSQARAAELKTVNGAVDLDEGARVSGSVRTVNGRLSLAKGADVSGDLRNVNGTIKVTDAHVGGGIGTVTGSIYLAAARIEGGIHIEKNHSPDPESSTPPTVVVGPGSVVKGTLVFERPVRLYVSDQASIGAVQGATPVKYSGLTAPAAAD